jgi:hypothetical protein
MLFYDYHIINALTKSRQPFLNRFQILAIAPVKPPVNQKSSWFDFHIILTISEPLISETYSFDEIKTGQTQSHTSNRQSFQKMKELPDELKLKILGNLKDFNDHQCGCSSVGSTLTDCLTGVSNVRLPRRNRVSLLFPISIRKRYTYLHSKMTDIYLVLRTETTRDPFYFNDKTEDGTFTLHYNGKANAKGQIINRDHFNRPTYDMNLKNLSLSDKHNSNYRFENHSDERDNPFYKKDSQFEEVRLYCELVS